METFDIRLIPIADHIPHERLTPFPQTKCFLCGRANQAVFTIAEIYHTWVTMTYPANGFYKPEYYPSLGEIRRHIWTITDGDEGVILAAKMKSRFNAKHTGLLEVLEWWGVYCAVRILLATM
jgi:hypothetical protein